MIFKKGVIIEFKKKRDSIKFECLELISNKNRKGLLNAYFDDDVEKLLKFSDKLGFKY